MISGLIGQLHKKTIKKDMQIIHLNVSNIIYEILIPINNIINSNQQIELNISEIIREDSITLYGFLDEREKDFFEILIKLNGVGPRLALSICSYFLFEEFQQLIIAGDITKLKRVPGVGDKIARRILGELSGKLFLKEESLNPTQEEAIKALESLGLKRAEVLDKVIKLHALSSQDIIKEVLKKP